jgi:hypothetical protein
VVPSSSRTTVNGPSLPPLSRAATSRMCMGEPRQNVAEKTRDSAGKRIGSPSPAKVPSKPCSSRGVDDDPPLVLQGVEGLAVGAVGLGSRRYQVEG